MTPQDREAMEKIADAIQQVGDGLHAMAAAIDSLLDGVDEKDAKS